MEWMMVGKGKEAANMEKKDDEEEEERRRYTGMLLDHPPASLPDRPTESPPQQEVRFANTIMLKN